MSGFVTWPSSLSSKALLVHLALGGSPLLTSCKEDKPYTPFEVATALPESPPAPKTEPTPSEAHAKEPSAGEPTSRRALKAPRGATTWTVGGHTLEAPDGHELTLALPLAPQPSSTASPPVLVWTTRRARDTEPATGTLWLYGSTDEGARPTRGRRRLVELPGFIPTSSDCEQKVDLDQTGPNTVTLDVSAHCTARLVARAPTRSILILDPLRVEPQVLGFRVADPAPGETLSLAVDSGDLDGDGRDDATLRVTVGRPDPERTATARFSWFDRTAGRSRDVSRPSDDFRKAKSRLTTLAKNKKTAASVAAEADALRRLYAFVCAEGATPRLWLFDGSPLSCRADASLAEVLGAEIEAELTLDHPLEAAGLLARDGWYGAKLEEKERARLTERILAALPHGDPVLVGSFRAAIGSPGGEPRWSPLLFDEERRLWIRTADARVQLSDPPGTEPRAPEPIEAHGEHLSAPLNAWPLRVESSTGKIWTGLAPSCDRSEFQLVFVGRDGLPLPLLPTTVLAPRPGACRHLDGRTFAEPVPIAWRAGQLEAWIAGTRLGTSNDPPPVTPGAPLSPDGKVLVLPSTLGVLVVRDNRPELWRGPSSAGLTSCVPEAGGGRVACVKGQSVVVLGRPATLSR